MEVDLLASREHKSTTLRDALGGRQWSYVYSDNANINLFEAEEHVMSIRRNCSSELIQPWLDSSYLTFFLGVITDSSIPRA